MIIIIPAYEPDNRVLKLIHEIKENSDFEIILINDGSAAKYRPIFEAAEKSGCTILTHKENQGKGAALKTAFSYLLEKRCNDCIICADCDGQHTWKDIQKIAKILPDHPSSIILGCREFIGKVPLKSKFGNKITRAVFFMITGNKIRDTQTGLRGFSSTMLPWLTALTGSRYEYEMNQLLKAKEAGFDFLCIPIQTIYENKNEGSHFNPIRDSIRIYLPIIKFSISSVLSAILDCTLLLLFKLTSDNLLLAVIFARVISSLCNYLLNRNLVFHNGPGRKLTTLFQYYLLAVGILGCNYLILSLLNEALGIPLFISKILTEGILYPISYTVQHKIIFKNQRYPQKTI